MTEAIQTPDLGLPPTETAQSQGQEIKARRGNIFGQEALEAAGVLRGRDAQAGQQAVVSAEGDTAQAMANTQGLPPNAQERAAAVANAPELIGK